MSQKISKKRFKFGRTDGAKEYMSTELETMLSKGGITHKETPPYSPHSNGRAKSPNRTLVEGAGTNFSELKSIKKLECCEFLWAEALRTTNYIGKKTLSNRNMTHWDERNRMRLYMA